MDNTKLYQTGRTTKQMKSSPEGAFYIWLNAHLSYPRRLAVQLGRRDLKIFPLSWFSYMRIVGRKNMKLVFDHSISILDLSEDQMDALDYLLAHEGLIYV